MAKLIFLLLLPGAVQVREEFPFGSSMALPSLTMKISTNDTLVYVILLYQRSWQRVILQDGRKGRRRGN